MILNISSREKICYTFLVISLLFQDANYIHTVRTLTISSYANTFRIEREREGGGGGGEQRDGQIQLLFRFHADGSLFECSLATRLADTALNYLATCGPKLGQSLWHFGGTLLRAAGKERGEN